MPKKFLGENTKAVVAKEKKLKAKEELRANRDQELEDQAWIDSCKKTEAKLKRREKKDEKRQQQLKRKDELKQLLKTETEDNVDSPNKNPTNKLTRLEILKNLPAKETSSKKSKNDVIVSEPLTENVNKLETEAEVARSIDEALSLFIDTSSLDKNREKRLKAEHRAYEQKRLVELRAENPSLKLSQLKECIFKEWQKMQGKKC